MGHGEVLGRSWKECRVLGDDIDLDLLAAHVVGDVLGGDGEGVAADWHVRRDHERAGVGGGALIPAEGDWGCAFEVRGKSSRGGGCGGADFERLATVQA